MCLLALATGVAIVMNVAPARSVVSGEVAPNVMICDRPYIVVLRDDLHGCDLFPGVINRVDGKAH